MFPSNKDHYGNIRSSTTIWRSHQQLPLTQIEVEVLIFNKWSHIQRYRKSLGLTTCLLHQKMAAKQTRKHLSDLFWIPERALLSFIYTGGHWLFWELNPFDNLMKTRNVLSRKISYTQPSAYDFRGSQTMEAQVKNFYIYILWSTERKKKIASL